MLLLNSFVLHVYTQLKSVYLETTCKSKFRLQQLTSRNNILLKERGYPIDHGIQTKANYFHLRDVLPSYYRNNDIVWLFFDNPRILKDSLNSSSKQNETICKIANNHSEDWFGSSNIRKQYSITKKTPYVEFLHRCVWYCIIISQFRFYVNQKWVQ
jgi:hypothetical protein